MTREISIRPARLEEAPLLTRLMEQEIWWSRLRELGFPFCCLVHRHLIRSAHSICLVAESGGAVVGYGAGTTDTRRFFRGFLVGHGLLACLLVLPRLFAPRRLATVLRGLTYFPRAPRGDPPAEMLSFLVDSRFKGQGIAARLLGAVVEEFHRRGIDEIKFGTVEATNAGAIAFYERMGLERVRTVPFYPGSLVHVYVYRRRCAGRGS